MSIVTINTDAGWYSTQKVGSFAFWIKGDGLKLSGSGIFRETCKSPLEAEKKAIINALYALVKCVEKNDYKGIKKIIFNRDNIYAKSRKKGDKYEKQMYELLKKLRDKSINDGTIKGIYPFYEFRHVKAHTNVKDKRSWVNRWCDGRCKDELRAWSQSPANTLYYSKTGKAHP